MQAAKAHECGGSDLAPVLDIAAQAVPKARWSSVQLLRAGIHGAIYRFTAPDHEPLIVKLRTHAAERVVNFQRYLYPFTEGAIYHHLDLISAPFPRPRLCGSGQNDQGEWVVLEAVNGLPLSQIDFERTSVLEQLGRLLREIHACAPPASLDASEWSQRFRSAFVLVARELCKIDPANEKIWQRCMTEGVPSVGVPLMQQGVLLHGDFVGSNILIVPTERYSTPKVLAVIDWEWSTVGDPLFDLARVEAAFVSASANQLYRTVAKRKIFHGAYGQLPATAAAGPWWRAYLLYLLMAPLLSCLKLGLPTHAGRPPEYIVAAQCENILLNSSL
jgi:Phosphotransferase enzyme family